jgi:hypothetical protein
MAFYDDITAGMLAISGAATVIITGLVQQLLKARRDLARHNSEIKVEKSDANAGQWLYEQAMAEVTKARMERDATMRAAKELLDQRMVDVEKIARTDEQLKNCLKQSEACEDRAQRAEARAALAAEHMREQTEQILLMGINIDTLTTELAKHDKEAAVRLAPKLKQQALLNGPQGVETS